MKIDYTIIPFILKVGSFDEPAPRGLRQLAEILNLNYRIFDHPIFNIDAGIHRIDPFEAAMDVPEMYKRFNRTIVERTIYQANFFSGFKVDNAFLTVRGQGIELALAGFREYWEAANEIVLQPADEQQANAAKIYHFKLIASGVFDAQLKMMLTTTQELITEVIKGHIADLLKKQVTADDKYKFLIKWRGDMLKQEEQFSGNSFRSILKLIDIELEVLTKTQSTIMGNQGLGNLVDSFFKEQEAKISNDKLLKALVAEDYPLFQKSLEEMVMRLFSYHDITDKEPERVYHIFLLGVFNSFTGVFDLKSNLEAGLGRFDLLLTPVDKAKPGLIFEVKRSATANLTSIKKQAYEALEQVRNNNYAIELKRNGILHAVSFAAIFFGKTLFTDFEINDL